MSSTATICPPGGTTDPSGKVKCTPSESFTPVKSTVAPEVFLNSMNS